MVKLLEKNPRLRFPLPLLGLALLGILYVYFLAPQLTLRHSLRQEVLKLEKELIGVQTISGTLSSAVREKKFAELQAIKENLGVGLDSPELVLLLEEKAQGNFLKISYWSFQQGSENNAEVQKRKINLVLEGKYLNILSFLAALEAYPAFSQLGSFSFEPGKKEMVKAYLEFSFSTIPLQRAKKTVDDLPLRDNPFK